MGFVGKWKVNPNHLDQGTVKNNCSEDLTELDYRGKKDRLYI